MTVSSMSETTPKRTSGATTKTRVSTGSPPSTDIVKRLPARFERAGEHGVDDAAAIGDHLVRRPADA